MVYIRKMKKKGRTYLSLCEGKRINGKTKQFHLRYIGVVPIIGDENTSKKDKKIIRNAQIIDQLAKGKSEEDLSYLYDVTIQTIKNIKKRFEQEGSNSLIHTRKPKYETIKVSSPEQAAIITDFVQNPTKNAKEIKQRTSVNCSIPEIEKMIQPISECLNLKKKILLEIQ